MANSPTTSTELTAIMHAQLKVASDCYRISRYLQVAGIGEELRRRSLLLDALDPFDQAFDLAELLRKVSDRVRDQAKGRLTPDYYASRSQLGLVRLRDHVRENAFWNKCLYHEAAQRATKLLIGSVLVAAAVMMIAIATVSRDTTIVLARIFVAFLAFVVAYSLFSDSLAWRSAARTMELLDGRLDGIKSSTEEELRGVGTGNMLTLFGEYLVATSKVIPVPEPIYKRKRDQLNRHWKERESGIQSPLL